MAPVVFGHCHVPLSHLGTRRLQNQTITTTAISTIMICYHCCFTFAFLSAIFVFLFFFCFFLLSCNVNKCQRYVLKKVKV